MYNTSYDGWESFYNFVRYEERYTVTSLCRGWEKKILLYISDRLQVIITVVLTTKLNKDEINVI